MPYFQVVVPCKTQQTFIVRATSAIGAKRRVTNWMDGKAVDAYVEVLDDIGMEFHRSATSKWTVEEFEYGETPPALR